MKPPKIISVWLHLKTATLWEHLPTSLGGFALTCVDIESTEFTSWKDWTERGLFYFDDEDFYNPENFLDLGEL
jgi:hypothetical protein